jgi:hypothetical protein
MLGGGGRLGGSGAARRGMTPRELAAEVCVQDLQILLKQSNAVVNRLQKDGLGMKRHAALAS